jgi:hypothetical protein
MSICLRPVNQTSFSPHLCGALGVHAAAGGFERGVVGGFGGFDFYGAGAHGAGGRWFDGLGVVRALVEYNAHDLRDDLAGFLDVDGVANAEMRARGGCVFGICTCVAHAAVVVQGGVLHGGACEQHGLHGGAGRDFAGLAHLGLDVQQDGGLALCGVLVCDGPARAFACEAQCALLAVRIDADDHAVDGVGHGVAFGVEVVDGCEDFVECGAEACAGVGGQAQLGEFGEKVPVACGEVLVAHFAPAVRCEAQAS